MSRQAVKVVHEGNRYVVTWSNGTTTDETPSTLHDAASRAEKLGLRLDKVEGASRVTWRRMSDL